MGVPAAFDFDPRATLAWRALTARPAYSGICFIEIALAAGDPRHRASIAMIGDGTLMAVEPGRGIIAHRHADGSVGGYVALAEPEDRLRSIDFTDPRACRRSGCGAGGL